MSETLTIQLTKAELIQQARIYTNRTYPDDSHFRHERLGMLVDFIGDLFYEERFPIASGGLYGGRP